MKKFPLLSRTLLIVFFSTFLLNGEKAHAIQSVQWYINPQGGSCSVATADTIPPSGYTLNEVCNYNNDGGCDYTYELCTVTYNDTNNVNGAVASFGASIDKNTYNPGTTGEFIIFGATEPIEGSEMAGMLLFFSASNVIPGMRSLICFFTSCPVTRWVSTTIDVPYFDDPSALEKKTDCLDTNPLAYGFAVFYDTFNGDLQRYCSFTQFVGDKRVQRQGAFYETIPFTVPLQAGNYSATLTGCHEKYYCTQPQIPLYFTVSPAAPTVQLFFGRLMEKIKGLFVSL